jgi:hypothetical protein
MEEDKGTTTAGMDIMVDMDTTVGMGIIMEATGIIMEDLDLVADLAVEDSQDWVLQQER